MSVSQNNKIDGEVKIELKPLTFTNSDGKEIFKGKLGFDKAFVVSSVELNRTE